MTELVHNLHGDIGLHPAEVVEAPNDAKLAFVHVLQSSDVTGNRHEVASAGEEIAHWHDAGKEYVYCGVDYVIRHVGGDAEHGEQIVQAGVREVRHEMEHDPWKNELKAVVD